MTSGFLHDTSRANFVTIDPGATQFQVTSTRPHFNLNTIYQPNTTRHKSTFARETKPLIDRDTMFETFRSKLDLHRTSALKLPANVKKSKAKLKTFRSPMRSINVDIKTREPFEENPNSPNLNLEGRIKTRLQALEGLRRFRKERSVIKQTISPKFSDTVAAE